MTDFLLRHKKDTEIVVVFANTGEEAEETLAYVKNCDSYFGFHTVWVEAVFDLRKGKGTRHKIVNFETASRNGEPFEAMCQKHGLPNSQFPHCTRELKLYPIQSYLKSIGWKKGTYQTAIGIRADEIDRMSSSAQANGIIYPLIQAGITKADVLEWEAKQLVRLGIPEHYGNCKWCWKKSFRKLATVAKEKPEFFNLPRKLESLYSNNGAGFGDRKLFRGRKTVDEIFKMLKDPDFIPYTDSHSWQWNEALDVGSACGESCEIEADN